MEWRIRESDHGFYSEYGGYIKPGTTAGFKPGFYMPGFNVSESARFDTRKQAEKYIASKLFRKKMTDGRLTSTVCLILTFP